MDALGIKIDVMPIAKASNVEQGTVTFGQRISGVPALTVPERYIYAYNFLFFYSYLDMFNIQ